MFVFLWGSSGNKHRYHLSNWQHLTWPKEYGGWGIKNLHWFNIALRLKNFWMVLPYIWWFWMKTNQFHQWMWWFWLTTNIFTYLISLMYTPP